MPKLRRVQGPRYIGGHWIYGGEECGSQRHVLVVPARWCRVKPHEWRQPTRARIGITWWPWQARWRTRPGARFLLQFKQTLDEPSQGWLIEQRVPHCSTVERTVVRSARAHGALDQHGAQLIAFVPQEQRGALRQLRVLGAQLRRREQRSCLSSCVGHMAPHRPPAVPPAGRRRRDTFRFVVEIRGARERTRIAYETRNLPVCPGSPRCLFTGTKPPRRSVKFFVGVL